jgi:hypothetical protein
MSYSNIMYQLSLQEYVGIDCVKCKDKIQKLKIAHFLQWASKNL